MYLFLFHYCLATEQRLSVLSLCGLWRLCVSVHAPQVRHENSRLWNK